MKLLNGLSFLLILAGALNWGLWGFFQFDFVAYIAGGNTTGLARLIYAVIGLAGVWGIGFISKMKAICCCSQGKDSGSCK